MRSFFKRFIAYVLRLEAQLVVRKYRPHIVAVTGSVGKTSTKDALYAVLAQRVHVRKSDKSFNSEIGLPLTILGVPNAWNNPFKWIQNIIDGLVLILFTTPYPQWLVLEVGADRPGDISSLASWLPVDIAVITRLPEMPVHVEFFDSPDAVVEEKAALIHALKDTGTLVVYADDARRDVLIKKAAGRGVKIVTFGLAEDADVRAHDFSLLRESGESTWPIGIEGRITLFGTTIPVSIAGTVGNHMMLPVTAAAAVGHTIGMDTESIAAGVARYEAPKGRMRLIEGIKGTLIIDDTYNASPAAVMAALDALADIAPKGRTIAMLADMLELGRHSVEQHKLVGAYAAGKVDMLVTVGFRARDVAESALNNGLSENSVLQYEDSDKAGDEVAELLQPGDCVLVKGSQSMRMERAVEHLMKEPERAPDLLVRQEENWKRR